MWWGRQAQTWLWNSLLLVSFWNFFLIPNKLCLQSSSTTSPPLIALSVFVYLYIYIEREREDDVGNSDLLKFHTRRSSFCAKRGCFCRCNWAPNRAKAYPIFLFFIFWVTNMPFRNLSHESNFHMCLRHALLHMMVSVSETERDWSIMCEGNKNVSSALD